MATPIDVLADACQAKIRYTLQATPKRLQDHLDNFLDQIDALVLTYLHEAQKSERTMIAAMLESKGLLEAAAVVRGQ